MMADQTEALVAASLAVQADILRLNFVLSLINDELVRIWFNENNTK
jgi:hypothetical protein